MAGFDLNKMNWNSLASYGSSSPSNFLSAPLYNDQLGKIGGVTENAITTPEALNIGNGFMGVMPDAAGAGGNWYDGMMGTQGKAGWGGMALNAGMGLGNLFMGMKQYGLAKDTLAENKRQFALNYGAQQKLTNSQLADRQNARIQSSPGANFESTAEYMRKYGV